MALKFVVLTIFVAVSRAGLAPVAPVSYAAHGYPAPIAYSAPVVRTVVAAPVAKAVVAAPAAVAVPIVKSIAADTDFDRNPQYSYSYDVQDALTGDSKSQHESRNGDVLKGSYSLIEADGTRRIVDYTMDAVNGFNAVVRKEAATTVWTAVAAPVVVKAAAPVVAKVVAAPIAKIAALVAYSAPVVNHATTAAFGRTIIR